MDTTPSIPPRHLRAMLSPYLIVDVLAAAFALWFLRKIFDRSRDRHLPPGPRGLPIIGNLLDLPKSQEWVTYSLWTDKWGECYIR